MVVAMIAMLMVQVIIDQIIDMIAVGDRLVTTAGAVNMFGVVTRTAMGGRATVRISIGHFEHMLFNLPIFPDMVQMAVVQVIDMVTMLNTRVFAIWPVLVIVMAVQIRHRSGSFQGESGTFSSIACMTPLVTSREIWSSANP